jgi:hypothetical protein
MGTPPVEPTSPVKEEPHVKPTMLGGMVDLFKANIGDTVAYLLIAFFLILSFFEPFLGQLPVGIIMGLYFSRYVFRFSVQFREFLVTDGIFHGFIVIAGIAALVISAPGLMIGLLVGTFSRPLFGHHETVEEDKPKEHEVEEQKTEEHPAEK